MLLFKSMICNSFSKIFRKITSYHTEIVRNFHTANQVDYYPLITAEQYKRHKSPLL